MTGTLQQAGKDNRWYVDWQHQRHARLFDGRFALPKDSLIRNYEFFSDVRLLNERLEALKETRMLEVGCATGEFSRYLGLKHPRVSYTGMDISQPAIGRARQKYPKTRFLVCDPGLRIPESLRSLGLDPQWPVLYTKDVLHHQTDPFGFLGQLLEACSDTLIFRTRTRDKGPTLLDPEQSCQYHYQGWMPYIVLNIDELVEQIRRRAPDSEIALYRNHTILGGKENRFLPKDCYLPETGTAETAVGVFLKSSSRRVHLTDRTEILGRTPWRDRLYRLIQRRGGRR